MLQTLAILLVFQSVGEVFSYALRLPVPGPVIGMILLFCWLAIDDRLLAIIQGTTAELLKHLSLLFVPAGVGIMVHGSRIGGEWMPIIVAPGGIRIANELGTDGAVIGGVEKRLAPASIEAGLAVDAIMHFGDAEALRPWRQALARRDGPIIPLVTSTGDADRLILERHVCIDTTASGGNAELLARPAGT